MKSNQQTIGISFFVRKNKLKEAKWPIFARITVNNERRDFSIKEWVGTKGWDEMHGRAKNILPELRLLNTRLEEIRGKVMQCYRDLQLNGKLVTSEALKRKFFGLDEQVKGLMELLDFHNTQMVDKLADGTLKNYRTTSRYLLKFLREKKKCSEIYLSELDYRFILEFEKFIRATPLKDFDPCHNNGLMKHMERLRKIARFGVRLGWMQKNPFESYQLNFKRYERPYLNTVELKKIENATLLEPALSLTRDLFIFGCYTGLAPIDLSKLTSNNIVEVKGGELWLHTERTKTGTVVDVPLLPKALSLIEKYKDHPIVLRRNCLFPVMTNQQINRSLKVIAEICQIDKYLTFYISRHTFATTVTLNNGVPLETVIKMLGHTKFSTTQIYAKLLNKKVGEDMALLKSKLSGAE